MCKGRTQGKSVTQIANPETLIRGIVILVRVIGERAPNLCVFFGGEDVVVARVGVLHV